MESYGLVGFGKEIIQGEVGTGEVWTDAVGLA
jgi:hypothetical protein